MTTDPVALYLASCIAATADDFDKRNVPKNERIRHRRLCELVANIVEGKQFPPHIGGRVWLNPDQVVERLRNAADRLKAYE